MADVTTIRAGRWALSRPVQDGFGWTTYASQQRAELGAVAVESYWPPFVAGAPAVNAVLVRLVGTSGAITQPADGNTRIFPRDFAAVADVTMGELTATQRNNLRTTLETWLTGYTFTDWDGQRTIAPFSDITPTYTANTTLRDIARDVFRHFAHSTSRPRPAAFESHNTEYTDDFSTDPYASRWVNQAGFDIGGTWDGTTDFELDVGGDNNVGIRYQANNAGSIEQEAQALTLTYSDRRAVGAGVRMPSGSAGGYGRTLDNGGNLQVWKFVGGTRTELTLTTPTYTAGHWVYQRMSAEGAAGANVVLSFWTVTVGSSTKPGSDAGWQGTDASPDSTYTDTAADRLDDSGDIYAGFVGRGSLAGVSRADYWKTRAISDRGGGAGTTDAAWDADATGSATFSAQATHAAVIDSDATSTLTAVGASRASDPIVISAAASFTASGASQASGALSATASALVQWVGDSVVTGQSSFSVSSTSAATFVGASVASGAMDIDSSAAIAWRGDDGVETQDVGGNPWRRKKKAREEAIRRDDEDVMRLIQMALPELLRGSVRPKTVH